MQKVTANTRICGIIGDPVEHSLSPAMHNAAFNKLGLDYIYLPFHVTAKNLAGAVTGLKSLNFRGMNVTIPHKINVIPLLDELEPMAEEIGAVNTIVNDNGHLKGYNTDAAGFLKALSANGIDPAGKKISVLGSGGAARAVSYILAKQGADIEIINRSGTLELANKLAANISRYTNSRIRAIELNDMNLKQSLKDADILVNATSVGMSPDTGSTLVPQKLLRAEMAVFDVIYNPQKTTLIQDAEKAGATAIGGLDMLTWQGALAFEIWTGVSAPHTTMKNTAAKLLEQAASR
jgi:shikimate dehydrogenase